MLRHALARPHQIRPQLPSVGLESVRGEWTSFRRSRLRGCGCGFWSWLASSSGHSGRVRAPPSLSCSTRARWVGCRAARSGNILESRRRICDGVDNTHGLLSGWCAHATQLKSVCLHSPPTGLTLAGREAVPDTIGVIEVHLVGCLSAKSIVGHSGVVLLDVEIDQLLELREAVERMQVVVPQNVIRREITAGMIAKATKRTEREPSRALVIAPNAQAKHGICLSSAQCAQSCLRPTPCGTETLAQAACRA